MNVNVNVNVNVKTVVTLEISSNAGNFLKSVVLVFEEKPFFLERVNEVHLQMANFVVICVST